MEILQLRPRLFAGVTHALWKAVGRLGSVPSLLSCGLLSPIFKNDGDPAEPSNNRPICLISVFRKVVGAALIPKVVKHYEPSRFQWGHRSKSGTECAVMFAIHQLRHGLPCAALLDLRKAYDMVPRRKLMRLIEHRLPLNLARTFSALLWPMKLRTKGQKANENLKTTAGVPQGDPTSPLLFAIFMDSYLFITNSRPESALSSLFVDDVLALARDLADLQTLLTESETWARKHDMVWSVAKSFGLDLPRPVQLDGQRLEDKIEAAYLGVTINKRNVTDTRLILRIAAAKKILHKIRRLTHNWPTTVSQRRMFIKTFVLPVCDYLLCVHPLTSEVRDRADELDRFCINYTLRSTVRPTQKVRGLCLARLMSFTARRRRNMIQTIARFRHHSIDSDDERHNRNWNIIASHSTLWPMARQASRCKTTANIEEWTKEMLETTTTADHAGGNNHKRWIPLGKKLPPAYRSGFSGRIENLVTRWYLNTIPKNRALSGNTEILHKLLSKTYLTDGQKQQVEQALQEIQFSLSGK